MFLKNNFFRVSIISLLMIYIGFSTYILIPIRAIDNPNINENSPDSWENFLSYMNRDQYGNFKNVDWKNILKYYLSPEAIGASKFGKLELGNMFWLTKKQDEPWKKITQFQGINLKNEEILDFDLDEKVFRKFQENFILILL